MLTKHDVQDLLTVARSIRGVCSDQRFDGRRKAEIVIERAHVLACGLELLLEDVPDGPSRIERLTTALDELAKSANAADVAAVRAQLHSVQAAQLEEHASIGPLLDIMIAIGGNDKRAAADRLHALRTCADGLQQQALRSTN